MAPVATAVLFFQLTCPLAAAQAATNAAPSHATASPATAAPAEPPVPQSLFVMPSTPQQGKDPFYPRSMRPYSSSSVVRTNQSAPAVEAELRLNGFSRLGGRRLAIVNNVTFAEGEDAEVLTGTGRIRIRCIEITDDTVVVQIGGERRTLRLRPGF